MPDELSPRAAEAERARLDTFVVVPQARRMEGPELAYVWLEETPPPMWFEPPETAWVLPEGALNDFFFWFEDSAPGAPAAEAVRDSPGPAPAVRLESMEVPPGCRSLMCEYQSSVALQVRVEDARDGSVIVAETWPAMEGQWSRRTLMFPLGREHVRISFDSAGDFFVVRNCELDFAAMPWTLHEASPLDPRIEGDNTARVEAALRQTGGHDLSAMSVEQIEALLDRLLATEEP